MVTILGCKYCGKEQIPFDSISANITLSKATWCSVCRIVTNKKEDYNFCSVQCLIGFVRQMPEDLKFKDA
jgi:hypothetical protein